MKILSAFLIFVLAGAVSCDRGDNFLEKPYPFNKSRYNQKLKFDTTSAESYAVDVDILWVIDNSGSMDSYQKAVIANSAAFIAQFTANSRLHWRMGLISTSQGEPPYMGFQSIVDWNTSNSVQIFNQAVARLGTNGDTTEATFQPTLNVLSSNPKWMRPNAYLILISVTDELEQSWISTQEFINQILGKLGGDISRFIGYGVFGPDSNGFGNRKNEELVHLTGGQIYSLNSPDYGILLAQLGQHLVQRTTAVNPIVVLDQRPLPKTIQVVYKGKILVPGHDWGYNSDYNYIRINNRNLLDPSNLDVEVSFEIDSNYKP